MAGRRRAAGGRQAGGRRPARETSRLVSTWLCLLCDDSLPTTLNGGRGQIATFITFVSGKMNLHADDLRTAVVAHKSLYSSLHLMAFEFVVSVSF